MISFETQLSRLSLALPRFRFHLSLSPPPIAPKPRKGATLLGRFVLPSRSLSWRLARGHKVNVRLLGLLRGYALHVKASIRGSGASAHETSLGVRPSQFLLLRPQAGGTGRTAPHLPRSGHMAVLNEAALRLASISPVQHLYVYIAFQVFLSAC
jgi:hypothetical protein